MKKNAWTMAEMVIALTIIIILSALMINVYKPTAQKTKLFLYSTMRNLEQGNISVLDHVGTLRVDDIGTGTNALDGYCVNLADAFDTSTAPDCHKNLTKDKVNFTFTNGVTIKGLAGPWVDTATDSGYNYAYKEILVDIDGSSGMNKIWVDQFPLRVYASRTTAGYEGGSEYEGMVMPADCLAHTGGGAIPASSSAFSYCPATGGKNYARDNELISYNIHRAETVDVEEVLNFDTGETKVTESKVLTVARKLSPMDSDCKAYGGTGLYTLKECADAGIRVIKECTNGDICTNCGKNAAVCPSELTTKTEAGCLAALGDFAATNPTGYNPYGLPCHVTKNKPRVGATLVLEPIIGSILDSME